MTYQTNNPVGSVDVRDLYDNAEAFDNFSAGPLDAYPDRFGVSRQSLQGIRNASQYVDLGPYAAGLNFTARNQVFSYLGEFYAPGPSITLPYTTTGIGAGEIANFRSVGDAVLRQDLAAFDGAERVGYGAATVSAALDDLSAFVNVNKFGAVADCIGLIGNGTDNTAAVQSAIDYALAAGIRRIHFPGGAGYYRFASASAPLNPGIGNLHFSGDGMDSSKILFEEGTVTVGTRKVLFGNNTTSLKGSLEFSGLGFNGTLTQKGYVEGGGAVMFLDYYKSINIHHCKFYDLSFMATACEAIRAVQFTHNHCERIVRDICRFRSSFNCFVTENYFKHNADDAVALHQANYVTGAGNIRDSMIVADNILEDTNGIRLWGARKAVVSGNILNRVKVDPISILGDATEGNNPMFMITVEGNQIFDSLNVPSFASPLSVVIGINSLGRKGGSESAGLVPGENSTTSGDILPVYPYLNNSYDGNVTQSTPTLFGVYIRNNIVARTLPSGSAYSVWGFGPAFSETGFVDPVIAEANMRPLQGLNLTGDARLADIRGNTFANLTQGVAISASANGFGMDGLLVADNKFYDVLDSGIWFESPAVVRLANVKVSRNDFNLDPLMLSPNREAAKNGTWQADTVPSAIGGTGYAGGVFESNTISNLARLSSNANDVSWSYLDNICKCDPAVTGFSTSNVGVGNVPRGGRGWVHHIADYNPKSVNFMTISNRTDLQSNGSPTTGKYVQGHFVQNVNFALNVYGYVRLSTGTGHVAGTDWKSVAMA